MNDCSWCTQEAGVTPTASPTICQRHEEMLLAQQAERKAARSAAKEEKTDTQRKAAA